KWVKLFNSDFKDEITAASPFVHYETMVKKGSIMHSVLVRGFEPRLREKVQSIVKSVEPASALQILQKEADTFRTTEAVPKVPGVIVGEGVLSILDAKIGDKITLISPRSTNFSELKLFQIVGV